MNTKDSVLLLTALLCVSCSGTKENSAQSLHGALLEQAKRIPVNDISIDYSKIFVDSYTEAKYHYSDLFKDVEYVTLDDKDDALVGCIDKMIITHQGDYIFFDSRSKSIKRFDSNGKFLNSIGQVGHASNEFITPFDVQYDNKTQQLFVLDFFNRKIKIYTIEGIFKKNLNIDFPVSSFGLVDENHIVINSNFYDVPKSGDIAYNLKVCDYEGNILKQYDPYTSVRHDLQYGLVDQNMFTIQGEKLYCQEMYSSLIFTFDGKELVPLYNLDFGEKQIPAAVLDTATSVLNIDNWRYEKGNVFCDRFYESKKHFVMELIPNTNFPAIYIIDKDELECGKLILNLTNDMSGQLDSNALAFFKDDTFYYTFDWTDAERELEHIEKGNTTQYTQADIAILKELATKRNIIIQKCTLK